MKKQTGFTLIELMIAILLGLMVIAATISIYVATARSSSNTVKSAQLNYDLNSAMTLMANDLRRAGYWAGALPGVDPKTNPFMSGTTNASIPSASCVLYTYDADGSGTVDANEYYGFKLDGNTLRMRLSGTTTADCSDGVWGTGELIDNGEIKITNLEFTLIPPWPTPAGWSPPAEWQSPPSPCRNLTESDTTCSGAGDSIVAQRAVIITMNGELVDDDSVKKTLKHTVILRNNHAYTGS